MAEEKKNTYHRIVPALELVNKVQQLFLPIPHDELARANDAAEEATKLIRTTLQGMPYEEQVELVNSFDKLTEHSCGMASMIAILVVSMQLDKRRYSRN